MDLDAVVHGEYAENTFRKNFTLSEAVAIKRALEPIERAAARSVNVRADVSAAKGLVSCQKLRYRASPWRPPSGR
jgi:hypothetical protein